MLSDTKDRTLRRFLRLLIHDTQHIDDFRVMLGLTAPTIRDYMRILTEWDWIYRTDDGRYALQRYAVPRARKFLGMDDDEDSNDT